MGDNAALAPWAALCLEHLDYDGRVKMLIQVELFVSLVLDRGRILA